MRHLVTVDGGGLPGVNHELARAELIQRNPGPLLYWWSVGDVGVFYVFYTRSGTQTVVVHPATTVLQLPYYTPAALHVAEGRL